MGRNQIIHRCKQPFHICFSPDFRLAYRSPVYCCRFDPAYRGMGTSPDLRVFLVNFYENLLCYDSVDLLLVVFLSTIVSVVVLVFLFTTMVSLTESLNTLCESSEQVLCERIACKILVAFTFSKAALGNSINIHSCTRKAAVRESRCIKGLSNSFVTSSKNINHNYNAIPSIS
jgi:hypothetical protein